ncbi:MHS family MFS transporter [Pseudoclavibacter chungangensis]|uniref:MHS family MFS transporter n=1 Tax=Pseudoclavibacter chungangensis TaxID=587635 RepID=A0A7J5BR87_9MICO|nr:MFS transporter [Pseudoclavibacter chungangensis]KAB1654296.1 MHS family MFS transporter [Pseudoclavibacter chungangensis]NYJ65298.1 MFS family permease [Pseudoclavibacter chungangensis]
MSSKQHTGTVHSTPRERRKVVAATVIGTTVEWYDFFIYANAAALVFNELFFKPLGPDSATLVSYLSIGLSFLFRPLGAFLAGHFGDKIGRKPMLVITLLLMGAATTLIGVLPTFESAGVLAPILLICLRVLQGISAGGEWGGAVLMAVEHAPKGRRGVYGMYPQLGVPLGMILAASMLAIMSAVSGDQWLVWGWRVPFLFSIVLVVIGFIVRASVDESPVFKEIAKAAETESAPIVKVFARHWKLVILCAFLFAANNAAGYMTTGGFLQGYATKPLEDGGALGMDRTLVLWLVVGSAAVWFITTLISGYLCDAIGRKKTFVIGWLMQLVAVWVLFPLVNMGAENPVMFLLGVSILAIPLGICYGPISVWYAETFPASVRFSGVSISYAIGAIVGGAFAPFIAQWLLQSFGTWVAVAVYLMVVTLLSLTATLLLRDRTNIPLDHTFEDSGQWASWEAGDDVRESSEIAAPAR